ncbi:MAG: hypothetical protein MJZ81_08105 [Bacteroidales bacterium]|nr:hypothetical protein [Bacteroidales bacterium]
MKKLILIALAALSFAACEKEKEEWTVNIESGKFVLLDKPYEHPYAGSTIRAIIFVEENDDISYNRPYHIIGNVPRWATNGDTILVNAILQEKYPRDEIIVTELGNVSLYEIKEISKK